MLARRRRTHHADGGRRRYHSPTYARSKRQLMKSTTTAAGMASGDRGAARHVCELTEHPWPHSLTRARLHRSARRLRAVEEPAKAPQGTGEERDTQVHQVAGKTKTGHGESAAFPGHRLITGPSCRMVFFPSCRSASTVFVSRPPARSTRARNPQVVSRSSMQTVDLGD